MDSLDWSIPSFGDSTSNSNYFAQLQQFLSQHPPGTVPGLATTLDNKETSPGVGVVPSGDGTNSASLRRAVSPPEIEESPSPASSSSSNGNGRNNNDAGREPSSSTPNSRQNTVAPAPTVGTEKSGDKRKKPTSSGDAASASASGSGSGGPSSSSSNKQGGNGGRKSSGGGGGGGSGSGGGGESSLKDRRASSGGVVGTGPDGSTGDGHSHDHLEDDEDDDDDHDASVSGTGTGRGRGRTSARRKEQNRNAQRAFRERKEKHLKELEDRVSSLESMTQDQADENTNLRDLVDRLQKENKRLLAFETAFTFSVDKNGVETAGRANNTVLGFGVGRTKPLTPPSEKADSPFSAISSSAPFSFAIDAPSTTSSLPLSPPDSTSNTSGNSPYIEKLFGADSSIFDFPSTTTSAGGQPTAADAASPAGSSTFSTMSSGSRSGSLPVSATTHATSYESLFGGTPSFSGINNTNTTNGNGSGTGSGLTPSEGLNMGPLSPFSSLFGSYRDTTADPFAVTLGGGGNLNGLSGFDGDEFDFLKVGDQGGVTTASPEAANTASSGATKSSSPAAGVAGWNIMAAPGSGSGSGSGIFNGGNACPLKNQVSGMGMDDGNIDWLCDELKAKATCQEAAKKALEDALKKDQHMAAIFSKSNEESQ